MIVGDGLDVHIDCRRVQYLLFSIKIIFYRKDSNLRFLWVFRFWLISIYKFITTQVLGHKSVFFDCTSGDRT